MEPSQGASTVDSVTAPSEAGPSAPVSLSAARDLAHRLIANVERVLIGKREVIELAVVAMFAEGHILLEDVPGTGKTMLARSLARSLGGSFRRIQFTPDLLPSDITGIVYFDQSSTSFQFRPGPIFASVVLADEINRATPRTQSALLEAMEERTTTVEGETRPLPQPFTVLATQNPIELEGTFPLPEAQLDRFLMRLSVGYPSHAEEDAILTRFQTDAPLTDLPAVAAPDDLRAAAAAVRTTHVTDDVRHYLTAVVRATRNRHNVLLGASPRASLALLRACQARAVIHGRPAVAPDDVQALAPAVLGHRLIVSPEARLRGDDGGRIIAAAIGAVATPVEGRAGLSAEAASAASR